ncbi:gelsolin repeat protein [Aspergillus sclerotialis]|uniref:Gelsolin repeat protein n=1 Tax=Aspergillus sclerotialis TaxID=2070753 RepID=A0A3A3A7C1_9EURO|nr:gelsolin repeat protein [Aspergillus sclerotialis]
MTSPDVDASEDVNDFLLRIRELGEKRDKEDEERTKKLEEEILQGRKEREARRAERARSISPTKESPLSDTFRLSTSSLNQRVIDPPEHLEPTVPASDFDSNCTSEEIEHDKPTATYDGHRELKSSEITLDSSKQSPTSTRSRNGTLSWQHRPASRDFNHIPSFISTSPTRENRLRTVSNVSDDQGVDRHQLSPPPSFKDSLSFRRSIDQSSDSPAPRKHSEDVPSDVIPNLSPSRNSPIVSREYNTEAERPTGDMDRNEDRSWSPSRPSSTMGDSSLSRRYSTVSSASTAPGLGSPVPLSSAQKFEARREDQLSNPPSPRRLSPERSTSPTKGLGGFVQSAMMKRSDSVSKRWSTQMPSGLSGISRTNSVASNRNSFAGSPRSDMPPTPTSSKYGRDGPPSPYRPGSSHSEATVLQQTKENERPSTPTATSSNTIRADATGSPTRQPLSLHTRSSSALGWDEQIPGSSSSLASRTMDSKRWSPTKASWLESALNRPDTPRHTKQSSQSSPWRERQARASVDLGRRGSFREVTPVGLMRSTAPGSHFKKPSISGIPDLPKSAEALKPKEPEPESIRETAPEPIKETELEPVNETVPEPIKEEEPDPVKEAVSQPVKEFAPEPLKEPTQETAPDAVKEPPPEPVEETLQVRTKETSSESVNREDNVTLPTETTLESSNVEKTAQEEPKSDILTKDPPKEKPSPLTTKSLNSVSSTREPISPRPKPQSPLVDFRGNLKRRETPKESPTKEEPLAEFKNVFGRLRKTETQNYVAPDELKENILRGKAALNVTGGPKKTQRVDEFKESILKQKEAMKAGGGSLRRNTATDNNALGEAASDVPEAIAKRNNMGIATGVKSSRSPDVLSSPSPKSPATPQLQARQLSPLSPAGTDKPKEPEIPPSPSIGEPGPEQAENEPADSAAVDKEQPNGSRPADTDSNREDFPSPKPSDTTPEAVKPMRSLPSAPVPESTTAPPTTEPHPIKGKLASRVNPALAGLLSRGPPAASDGPKKALPTGIMGESSTDTAKDTSTGPLTHMTKNRARGPKRRLPASTVAATASTVPTETPEVPGGCPEHMSINSKREEVESTPIEESARNLSTEVPSPPPETMSFDSKGLENKTTSIEPTLVTPVEPASPNTKPTSFESKSSDEKYRPDDEPVDDPIGEPVEEPVTEPATQSPEPSSPIVTTTSERPTSSFTSERAEARASLETLNSDKLQDQESSNRSLPVLPSTSFSDQPAEARYSLETFASGKLQELGDVDRGPETDLSKENQIDREIGSQGETDPDGRPISPMPASPPLSHASEHTARLSDRHLSPSPSPQTSFEEDKMISPVHTPRRPLAKFGINGPREMSPREKSLPSLPVPPKDSLDKQINGQLPSPVPSPVPMPSIVSDSAQAKEILTGFFRAFPNCNARVDIDPQLILTSGQDDLKTRTLKTQIWEITADVKRQDLPANQEYILYEGSMYLCAHVFEIANSTRTEVQLWCGDHVPEAAIDDAQGFARKVARENGCKLELLKQGKESPRFIQALGGILITRRGSNSRSSSSALYMLCGRRHLGQMVFDEVDLSRRNLCSGYPFVISAPFGNLYLWKGKGSGAEEIGAARLIGMDLGLTGEIEEVAEGEEPESFFENFPDYKGSGEYMCSDYWQLKPNHVHFRTRLLRINHELGQRSGFWIRRPGTSSPVIRPNDTIQEIVPFCYKDLTSKDVYVLDIFFEIYVIVGNQASQRSAEFASAVIFAHEYGILAASLQDRPFIPKTFVSIGGLPDSCRSVFRKWDKRSWQIPLRVLTLNAAIDAIRC